MTLQQIDEELLVWDGRLAAIADNLLWLQSDSTFLILKGADATSQVRVAGKTAQHVEPALRAVPVIFDHFNLLHSTIDQAKELRKALPAIFGVEQKAAEIERLLHGRSIQLPAAVAGGQRSLLSGAHGTDCVTPSELLEAMVQAFAAARDAAIAVEHAWRDLAAGMDQAEAMIQRSRERLTDASEGLASELKAVEGKLGGIREQLGSDPLGALDALKKDVQPELVRIDRAAAAAEMFRQEILQAHAQLEELTVLHRQSLAAVAEAQAVIADPELTAPLDEGRRERLREWLEQLERRRREGGSATLESGLKHWREAADECIAQEKRAQAGNHALLEVRRELRGRLDALKAKARARGVAELAEIAELAEQGRKLLATRPTDLKSAAETVTRYADAVNAAGVGTAKVAEIRAAEKEKEL